MFMNKWFGKKQTHVRFAKEQVIHVGLKSQFEVKIMKWYEKKLVIEIWLREWVVNLIKKHPLEFNIGVIIGGLILLYFIIYNGIKN